jgi:hypothetical protein
MDEVIDSGLPVVEPFDVSKCFDVSHYFDAKYEGVTENPFEGMSTAPGRFMLPFQRSDMEQRLRYCIETANKLHWRVPRSGNGNGELAMDVLALRAPTDRERKALKLGPETARWADEAARIRAYLTHLDAVAARVAKQQRDEKRELLKRRSQVDPVAANSLRRTMSANKTAAMRHRRRLEDERAFREYILAENELKEREHKAAVARQELEAMR